ncbi:hypothetical protein TrVE_jg4715 [Triparma verrucosa]|uniref:Ribosomal protein eL8/eL30/eS12/Gadd45 domain-containing protein n=1 Tax=Triparma verrucosa TaxID=1606542 RepID=A0A9W7FAH3_9STRA|nr:hypothetical protein TrVE_jg4715 [Triparma verrucosa]
MPPSVVVSKTVSKKSKTKANSTKSKPNAPAPSNMNVAATNVPPVSTNTLKTSTRPLKSSTPLNPHSATFHPNPNPIKLTSLKKKILKARHETYAARHSATLTALERIKVPGLTTHVKIYNWYTLGDFEEGDSDLEEEINGDIESLLEEDGKDKIYVEYGVKEGGVEVEFDNFYKARNFARKVNENGGIQIAGQVLEGVLLGDNLRSWVIDNSESFSSSDGPKYVKLGSREEAVKDGRPLVVTDSGLECRILNFDVEWESDDEDEKEEVEDNVRSLVGGECDVFLDKEGGRGQVKVKFWYMGEGRRVIEKIKGKVVAGKALDVQVKGETEARRSKSGMYKAMVGEKVAGNIDSILEELERQPIMSGYVCGEGEGEGGGGTDDSKNTHLLIRSMLEALNDIEYKQRGTGRGKRRMVKGFREVERGLRANKVKAVILANNVEDTEAVHEVVRGILSMCVEKNVPVYRGKSRRQLGKILKKSIKITVVGVENFEGVQQEWKKLKKIWNIVQY